ncbi:hypothetical protein PZ938_13720 [Luteipulveratus sp. YIM 133132]|uniref:hypothetical protein n=1 Tax=Luteipulveratus flavus TaxID=3031728 RepID=UPI0023AF5DF0|nr:hypothetical protein [Luteipulveratus sp. YIM 133132]MDE9366667.1 hypothetical protein [Luteipulveratus sp. YIM 133132]
MGRHETSAIWFKRVIAMTCVLLSLTMAAVVTVVICSIFGSPYPAEDELPDLPAGLVASSSDLECAGAGCWRTWTISGPDHMTAAEVAARLGGAGQSCGHHGWFDWREACTTVHMSPDQVTVQRALAEKPGGSAP